MIFCQTLRDKVLPNISMSCTDWATLSSLTDWEKSAAILPVIAIISEQ